MSYPFFIYPYRTSVFLSNALTTLICLCNCLPCVPPILHSIGMTYLLASRRDYPAHNGNAVIRYQRVLTPRVLHQSHWCLDRRVPDLRVRSAARIRARELRVSLWHAQRKHEESETGDGSSKHGRCVRSPGHGQQHNLRYGELNSDITTVEHFQIVLLDCYALLNILDHSIYLSVSSTVNDHGLVWYNVSWRLWNEKIKIILYFGTISFTLVFQRVVHDW